MAASYVRGICRSDTCRILYFCLNAPILCNTRKSNGGAYVRKIKAERHILPITAEKNTFSNVEYHGRNIYWECDPHVCQCLFILYSDYFRRNKLTTTCIFYARLEWLICMSLRNGVFPLLHLCSSGRRAIHFANPLDETCELNCCTRAVRGG